MPPVAENASDLTYSIVVDGLTKTYGDFRALNNISFRIKPGEIVGFLGPNGAGKTTTMKILTCFMAATAGEARVAGFDVRQDSEAVRQRIGYLPENVPLYDEMIVYDYLRFVAEVRGISRAKRHERIKAAAELTGLEDVISRTIHELSKGYRQRVGLAQAIIHEPDVIILDEPTTGLDPNQIIEIRDVIKTIGREKTIIFSTHIMQEVTAVCDRIIIINNGELVADGTIEDLEARVSDLQPGLLVSFESTRPPEELQTMLEGLPGVDRVQTTPARSAELGFRLETSDEQAVRRALVKHEAEHDWGLKSLRQTEPTLEDIFRVFTAGSTEEESDSQDAPDAPNADVGEDQEQELAQSSEPEAAQEDEVAHA